MKNIAVSILLSLLLMGCQNSITSTKPEIGEPFKIKLGQTLEFQDEDLSITFKELLEDSRCPEGATCVWAGNGRVLIKLNDLQTELNTYLDPKQSSLTNYIIELVSLSPYPKLDQTIRLEDYMVEVIINKS